MTPEEKLEARFLAKKIYKYNNGFETVWEDPAVIDERFLLASEKEDMNVLEKWTDLPRDDEGKIPKEIASAQVRLYQKATYRYIPLIRKAMNLQPFDPKTGDGLAGEEVLDLWSEFLSWKHDLKKNTEE